LEEEEDEDEEDEDEEERMSLHWRVGQTHHLEGETREKLSIIFFRQGRQTSKVDVGHCTRATWVLLAESLMIGAEVAFACCLELLAVIIPPFDYFACRGTTCHDRIPLPTALSTYEVTLLEPPRDIFTW
jgi:hypothetical protein